MMMQTSVDRVLRHEAVVVNPEIGFETSIELTLSLLIVTLVARLRASTGGKRHEVEDDLSNARTGNRCSGGGWYHYGNRQFSPSV
jgi:hypothetical protein